MDILSTIASSKAMGQRFQVSDSLSIKTGVAPKYKMGLADAELKRTVEDNNPYYRAKSVNDKINSRNRAKSAGKKSQGFT